MLATWLGLACDLLPTCYQLATNLQSPCHQYASRLLIFCLWVLKKSVKQEWIQSAYLFINNADLCWSFRREMWIYSRTRVWTTVWKSEKIYLCPWTKVRFLYQLCLVWCFLEDVKDRGFKDRLKITIHIFDLSGVWFQKISKRGQKNILVFVCKVDSI